LCPRGEHAARSAVPSGTGSDEIVAARGAAAIRANTGKSALAVAEFKETRVFFSHGSFLSLLYHHSLDTGISAKAVPAGATIGTASVWYLKTVQVSQVFFLGGALESSCGHFLDNFKYYRQWREIGTQGSVTNWEL
tara:strand:- start:72 stop:479 length:408 start_codon:yes stop_codon:yes gene_type:complete